jgi:integrase/recombinase XerD
MLNGRLQRSPRCMDAGTLGAFVEEFTNYLTSLGHTRLTVTAYGDGARHFAEWLQRCDIAAADIDDVVMARFARHRCACTGCRQHHQLSAKYVRRVRRFVTFLVERGVAKPAVPVARLSNPRTFEFQDWLRHHRGISERTIDRHGRMITRLLPGLGADPERYDAELVRRVIVAEAQRSSRPYIKTMMSALRGYLRFLAARGACRPWLDRAVPTIPQWRLSALPRYLPPGEVERLIASCDLTKPHGIRDKAILLLLARLGLRAGDILDMRLEDIVWNEGALRVRGKARREVRLPLPQDAGDALVDTGSATSRRRSDLPAILGTVPAPCKLLRDLGRGPARAEARRDHRPTLSGGQSAPAFGGDGNVACRCHAGSRGGRTPASISRHDRPLRQG